jgi:hypothetical protein
MKASFEALVRDLDQATLEELRQSVASEIEGRAGFQVESIHPRMTGAEREQASREIARVLQELK